MDAPERNKSMVDVIRNNQSKKYRLCVDGLQLVRLEQMVAYIGLGWLLSTIIAVS
jgi:hypothetical protein